MNSTPYLLLAVIVLGLLLWTGCATRRPSRPTVSEGARVKDPPDGYAKSKAWYIESAPTEMRKAISCSFVEFDERGDYLDFPQHRHAYSKIRELSKQGERLLVVIYVHGWKNNSQSGDVVEFNSFLERLARSPLATNGGYRVHGVYLAWRGNAVKHALDEKSLFYTGITKTYGEPIVDRSFARRPALGWLLWPLEQLSYWSRKNAAEDRVSGVSMVRTIFTIGHTTRRFSNTSGTNIVFLMGHSMGALMLEQSFAPATLARLTAEWAWDDEDNAQIPKANPLPFDLVMLVNSASPSIYAKQFYNYMVAHRRSLVASNIFGADAPLVISLTSTADSATGKVHPIGNWLAPLYPSLWRKYRGDEFILARGDGDDTNDLARIEIPQHYYYRRTPGHNPLLVNHWIVPAKTSRAPEATQSIFQQNAQRPDAKDPAKNTFHTSPRKTGLPPGFWEVTTTPPDPAWSTYKGHKPVFLASTTASSGYWIVRCDKEIIRSHNDIWSQQAMETYTAFFSIAEHLRGQLPRRRR